MLKIIGAACGVAITTWSPKVSKMLAANVFYKTPDAVSLHTVWFQGRALYRLGSSPTFAEPASCCNATEAARRLQSYAPPLRQSELCGDHRKTLGSLLNGSSTGTIDIGIDVDVDIECCVPAMFQQKS